MENTENMKNTAGTIGIIGAMDVEVEMLKEKLTERKDKTVSGITFASGILGGKKVVVAKCGIGKVFAAVCAQTMILEFNAEKIINTGVGGTLTDKLSVGDTAVSTALVQHDMDTTALGDPAGLVSGINKIYFEADGEIVKKAVIAVEEQGIKCLCGVIASGDTFVASKEKKNEIKDNFNAIVCEMEGASIAHTAYINNVPFVVIRAISDSADGSADTDYPAFVKRAAQNSASVTEKLVSML